MDGPLAAHFLVSSLNSMDASAAIQATNSKVEDEKARHSKRYKIKQLNLIPLGAWCSFTNSWPP